MTIATGAYLLVVGDTNAFTAVYGPGLPIAGQWESGDRLNNGGENIKLTLGSGTAIHEFEYGILPPWPPGPSGLGYSLTLACLEAGGNHANPARWRASVEIGGSPGSSDATPLADWLNIHGLPPGDGLDDTDGDGLVDVVEYGLDSDPNQADTALFPVFDAGGPRLDYTRARGADDVSVIAEFSADLLNWQPVLIETIETQVNAVDLYTVRAPGGSTTNNTGYFRLRIELRN